MKKFIYILATIIITNFFLPFGLIITADLVQKNLVEAADDCTIVSAKWNPAGEQANDFYDDGTTGGAKTQGNIIVKTKNCVGQTDVNLTIYESDGLTSLTDNTWNNSGLDRRVISIPTDNFTINMELGEEDCEARKGIFDCSLYFKIRKGDVVIHDSFNKSSGRLYYECDDVCMTNADLLMVIPNGSDDEPVNMDAQNPTSTPNTYELLAPIGEFKFAPDNIGEYFNTIFMIAIGLCGALAVVMIVLGGIQYMGDESVFGKTEAKSKIFAAILGLLIALGSYALLNTINPDFLNGGVHIDQVSAEIEEENITEVGSGANVNGAIVKISTGSAANCVGGVVDIPNDIPKTKNGKICKDLLTKLYILKSKTSGWQITSSIRGGGTQSSCHLSGNAKSGNCVDIQITPNPRKPSYSEETGSTNPAWGNFCVAVAQINGLNYANEASSTGKCQDIKKYKAYKFTSGPHLHINLISN